MKSNKNYSYILIGNMFYINIEQRSIELLLILYGRTKPFSFFERKTGIPLINRLPGFLIRLLRVLQFTYEFQKVKKDPDLINSLPKITTKYFGQCLLELRQGEIKIFNLKEQVVTTKFQCHVSTSEIRDRVNVIEKVTNLAPKLISWNTEERYIVEDYVNFNRPSYDFNNIGKYYSETFPILDDIRSTAKPKLIDLQSYILNKMNYVESKVEYILDNYPGSIIKVDKIKDFASFLMKSLKNLTNQEGLLVFSHGDLWEGNILIKNSNYYVIDWDTIDYRSFYFDFYYSLFMLASKNTHFEKVDKKGIDRLIQKMEPSFKLFYGKLQANDNFNYYYDTVVSLEQLEMYRYLFYLELVYLKLQSENVSEDKQLSEVTTWIKRFELYEENLLISR